MYLDQNDPDQTVSRKHKQNDGAATENHKFDRHTTRDVTMKQTILISLANGSVDCFARTEKKERQVVFETI